MAKTIKRVIRVPVRNKKKLLALYEKYGKGKDFLIQLVTPAGDPVEGTYETIPGRANVLGCTVNQDGSLDPEWEGGTEIFWDGQETVRKNGERLWLDADGNEWRESDLIALFEQYE